MRWIVATALVVGLTACATGGGGAAPPQEPPYITGTVTSATAWTPVTEGCVPPDPAAPDDGTTSSDDPPTCQTESDHVGTILVEEQSGGGGNKTAASVTTATSILRAAGEDYEPAAFADLDEGAAVSVWITGPVAESFPTQTTASVVIVE